MRAMFANNWARLLASLTLAGAVLGWTGAAAARVPRAALGRDARLAILVDKVMQPEAGWRTEEWMVAEAAAAGFNVFSPREGHDDLEAVRRVNGWCQTHGMYHMPWMRGSLEAPADSTARIAAVFAASSGAW